MPDAVERTTATPQAEQFGGGDVGDPINKALELELAFAALGKPVPDWAKQQQAPAQVKPEAVLAAEAQSRANKKALEVVASSQKQANMLRAIRESPVIPYLCLKDRDLMLNRVVIRVPRGRNMIPKIIADVIDDMDAHDHWAEAERQMVADQATNSIHQRPASSFQTRRIERFSISAPA